MFDVNVTGTFRMLRAVLPGMRERGWGRVVNFASMAGKDGNPNLSAYSASKAAVIAMTKSVGKELATSGVVVNAVAPAVFETPMNADTAPGGARAAHLADPDGPARAARGGRRPGLLALLGRVQLLHRERVRPQRRTGHVLTWATSRSG